MVVWNPSLIKMRTKASLPPDKNALSRGNREMPPSGLYKMTCLIAFPSRSVDTHEISNCPLITCPLWGEVIDNSGGFALATLSAS